MEYKNYLSPEQERMVWENRELTARQLSEHSGAKVWHIRYFLYSRGYRKMEVEYWTDEQVQFLKDNFRQIGDKELARIFEERWPKNKPWTLKHIEKKRLYLKLKRTKEETFAIHHRNKRNGAWSHIRFGSMELSDNYVVGMNTIKDRHLREELKQHPELIEALRLSMKIKRITRKQKRK